jgi:hypothetical protein
LDYNCEMKESESLNVKVAKMDVAKTFVPCGTVP